MEKIVKNYLEIKSLDELVQKKKPNSEYFVEKVSINDFQLNKFFYKQIGKYHNWFDRLVWTNKNWIEYVSNSNLFTFVLKKNENIAGFFELIYHKDKLEIEIAYFGLLKEFFGKKLGGFMLSEAIKKSFNFNIKRVWVHTCSLDHPHALKNYLSRGMSIYNAEVLWQKIA